MRPSPGRDLVSKGECLYAEKRAGHRPFRQGGGDTDLSGKVAVITGAGGVLCSEIPAYSGAKAAVTNLTQWLAVHFSRQGIRVNAIAPGFFAAGQNQQLLYNPDGTPTARTPDGTPTARTGKILAATPMGRFGDSRELEGALLFLVNDAAASFITGVTLPVDGGFSAYSGV